MSPRPSSVVCPTCGAPVNRACVVSMWKPGVGGNTLGRTHPARRALALASVVPEAERLAQAGLIAKRLRQVTLAVEQAVKAGATTAAVKNVVREALYERRTSHPISNVQDTKGLNK